jgi:hypothetical protein
MVATVCDGAEEHVGEAAKRERSMLQWHAGRRSDRRPTPRGLDAGAKLQRVTAPYESGPARFPLNIGTGVSRSLKSPALSSPRSR